MEPRTLPELLRQVAADNAGKVAYRFKRDGAWCHVDWPTHAATVSRVARSLIALGVAPGDRVAILSETRLEWVQCDFGIVHAGAATVGVYPSNPAEDCAYVIDHCGAAVAFVENARQMDKLASVRDRLPRLKHVVMLDRPGGQDWGALDWDAFLALGATVDSTTLAARSEAIRPEDLASLVYTSGTTGQPKAVMLTHRNLVFTSWCAGQCLSIEPRFQTLLFLPLAHVFARLAVHACMRGAATVAFAESMTTVAANLREIRPEFLLSVPRIYEKIQERVMAVRAEAPAWRQRLFDWALAVGRQAGALEEQGRPWPAGLRIRRAIANRLVFSKIHAAFGGRLAWAVAGGAPMNVDVARFFHACGITILEGIGMTENSSFSNVNPLGRNKFGTVGPAGPGVEVRIAEDGEVLFRGANVMAGYFNDPQATAETIDAEGWLHSGDIGEIDADGYLKITDRKKDLIVTSGGKNVAPQRIERLLSASPYISNAMVYGDRRKFLTGLVALDLERVKGWAASVGLDGLDAGQLASEPRVHELIQAHVDACNLQLAPFETIKRFRIAPREFTVDGGELTPTLKLRRRVVIERYHTLIDDMYVA